MKVSVIGAGRVGLSLSAALAEAGHAVLLTDKDKGKILDGERGPSFYEPGLKALLSKNRRRLQWTADPEAIVRREILFAALSLPVQSKGDFDLSGLKNWTVRAARSARLFKQEKLLIIKSALPPGAVRALQGQADKAAGAGGGSKTRRFLHIVYGPEFLRQGFALKDIRRPTRTVLAGLSASANQKAADFHSTFSKGDILFTSPEEAEIGKLACNSFLALKISFANLTADLQDILQGKAPKGFFLERGFSAASGRGGGTLSDGNLAGAGGKTDGALAALSEKGRRAGGLQDILGSDPRIGKSFLQPGLGWGGPCLPKDLKALIFHGEAAGLSMNLLKEAENLNQKRTELFYHWIKRHVQGVAGGFSGEAALRRDCSESAGGEEGAVLSGKTLAFWGISFKAGTDDISASPAAALAERLFRAGARLQIFDPLSPVGFFENKEKQIVFCRSPLQALSGAFGLVIGTDDKRFRKIPLKEIKRRLKQPLIADGRAVFPAEELQAAGFVFYQAGAPFV